MLQLPVKAAVAPLLGRSMRKRGNTCRAGSDAIAAVWTQRDPGGISGCASAHVSRLNNETVSAQLSEIEAVARTGIVCSSRCAGVDRALPPWSHAGRWI
jgi:hypothetical protein